MAKLKTERIIIKDDTNETALDFNIDINVAQDGEFTTTIPKSIVEKLKEANIDLGTNGRRNGREGFFSERTLSELVAHVKKTCTDLVKRELVSESVVIQYIIQTTCSYMIEKGQFIPNGSWPFRKSSNDHYTWLHGTVDNNAASPEPFGLLVWTDVMFKRKYRYGSGVEKTIYEPVHGSNIDEKTQPHLLWLQGIVAISKPESSRRNHEEIEYTEEVAEFFCNIYKSIFALNEKIKHMVKPEAILKLIENKQKLLS